MQRRSNAESMLVSDIIHRTYPVAQLYRINTGCVKTATGYQFSTGTPAGFPDLAGYRRSDGRAVYIEVKVAPNKPTDKQLAFLAQARSAGCLAGVAYSAEEAVNIILGE